MKALLPPQDGNHLLDVLQPPWLTWEESMAALHRGTGD